MGIYVHGQEWIAEEKLYYHKNIMLKTKKTATVWPFYAMWSGTTEHRGDVDNSKYARNEKISEIL